jgi:hypothetical protein
MREHIRALAVLTAVSAGLVAISCKAALSQQADRPKLAVTNIGLSVIGEGFYNANVNVVLQRTGNPQINFGFFFQRVRSLDEVYEKLRPAVDDLADELKHAEIVIPH